MRNIMHNGNGCRYAAVSQPRAICPRDQGYLLKQNLLVWLGFTLLFAPLAAIAELDSLVASNSALALKRYGQLAIEPGSQAYSGDGLAVASSPNGAQLRCVFQRLNANVTTGGLWLVSTKEGAKGEPFRVVARALGRGSAEPLALSGKVEMAGQVARFVRSGLTEEYSVGIEGLRQDFLIERRPPGQGSLRLELEVDGARAETMVGGPRLVLDDGGRKMVYNRLKAKDAQGKQLTAKLEVLSARRLAVVLDDAAAEYPVRIDPTFSDANWVSLGGGFPGVDGNVHAVAVDGAGNLYIGGDFDMAGSVSANNVAEWNGSSWSALGSGTDGSVYTLAVSGTNLFIGGQFTTAGGVPANNIAEWKGNAWSPLGSGISGYNLGSLGPWVEALAVSGSNLNAGGAFSHAGGVSANSIAEWNGSSWSALGPGISYPLTGLGYGPFVDALAVAGTNLFVGGTFGTAGGVPASNIAQWNGSSWSALGWGIFPIDARVFALAVSGTNLFAGGNFNGVGNSIAQWNGNSWNTLGSGINGQVLALAVAGNTLFAAGQFTTAGGVAVNDVAEWNGTSWLALGSGISQTNGNGLYGSALAVSGTNLFVGGAFDTAGGVQADAVAQWNGSSWYALGSTSGINGPVNTLAVWDDNLYVGGAFSAVLGVSANCIAEWNGSSWSALGSGIAGTGVDGHGPYVQALTVLDNKLYVGGDFNIAGGMSVTNIAEWNGDAWSALGSGISGMGADNRGPYVSTLAASGNKLYAGGDFSVASGTSATNIAEWNGTAWSPLGSGISGTGADNHGPYVSALAVSDNNLYVGGDFSLAGGTSATNIAEWNGSSWSALGLGISGYQEYQSGSFFSGWVTVTVGPFVSTLVVSRSNLFAGGVFTTAGGVTANCIAQWNGSSWSALGSGRWVNPGGEFTFPLVSALAASGNNLYVGGEFNSAGGISAANIAEWNGKTWSDLGSGVNGSVSALAVDDSANLYVGGSFTTAGTNVSFNVAEALLPGIVYNPVTRYVSQGGTNPRPPYTNWLTAATNIQDAVNVGVPGDSIMVTNGVYPGGVTVTNPLALVSVNGPQVTVIDGGGTNQCVSLTGGASLAGFTLTNSSDYGVSCDASGVVSNCVINGNSGGGANGGTLDNCTLSGNFGDGADSCILYDCALTGNSGLGAAGGANYNCTLTGNAGGGVSGATLYNCIVYFNTAFGGANYDAACALSYCCTTPLPPNGAGNIVLDPQLASAWYLSAGSPCIGAGSATYASGTDIDGNAWNTPPSIGCDEYHFGAFAGPLTASLTATFTNVATGFPVVLTALIAGRSGLSVWDFGDGSVEVNEPYTSHTWTAPGDYLVRLWAYNDSYPGGVAASVTVHVIIPPTCYVSFNNPSPIAPYSTWATAATHIQDAVDVVSVPGALVLVTNGVYAPVTVNTPLTLQSVNGPEGTEVDGGGVATCVYLTNNAVLVGFTLVNGAGAEGYGGGAYCESSSSVLTNCTLTDNNAGALGGGAYGGTLNHCTLSGNAAAVGGGAYGSTLNNCTLSGNAASGPGSGGGGAYGSTLNHCTLTGNSGGNGGGANFCTLNNCTLMDNSAWFFTGGSAGGGGAIGPRVPPTGYGGGANFCSLNNCTLTGNSAQLGGGGTYGGTLNNCVVSGNTNGGAYGSTLNNCTITGNSGWGASSAELNNCIVYFNSDPNGGNYDMSTTLNYCCTTPLPSNGAGNISADPELASATYLSPYSPCIGAGNTTYATGADIDGEAWASPPSIGCEEYHAGTVTGPLSVAIAADYTTVLPGFPVHLTAFIAGRTDLSVWDFGDSSVEVNEPYTSHIWTAPGDYLVALWAYNDSYPGGVSATVTIHVVEGVYYVAASSGNPVAPYSAWATAATNIQDAVNVAPPGATIFVTNGTYAPLTVNTPLKLQSVNGPEVTVINGGGAVSCVYLTNGVVLVGFTLTNGQGGVYCQSTNAVLSNCVLTGNSADGSGVGGGASGGTLNNCTLTGNSAPGGYGGGAWASTLNNCTLTGNSAYEGGGAFDCTLNNCIVYFNTAMNGANHYEDQDGGVLNYCCTTPLPTNGVGNITSAPLFMNYPGGNLRLQSNSPCINSGNTAYVVGSTDLDGNPRIVGGTVDIGAYECQTPVSMISYAWLQQYGLPISTNTDTADLDGTGMNLYQDWIAGLNPTNALSVLKMLAPSATNSPLGLTVRWQSVSGITYFLQRSTNLAAQPAFITIQSNIVGQAGTTTFTDTNAVGSGPFFYRVGVGN